MRNTDKDKLNRLLGRKKGTKRKKKIEIPPHHPQPYPVRPHSLGKTGGWGSEQGVGGWRGQYHRLGTPVVQGEDFRAKLRYNH